MWKEAATCGDKDPIKPQQIAPFHDNSGGTLVYRDLVAEGIELVAALDEAWWRLAELADKLPTVYGNHTLEEFKRDTGATCSLDRRLTVWRCWKSAARPILNVVKSKYAVARVLSTHPYREDFISQNPNLTTREAEEIMRGWRADQPKAEPESPPAAEPVFEPIEVQREPEPPTATNWRRNETRRWYSSLYTAATELARCARMDPCDDAVLRDVMAEMSGFLPKIREANDILNARVVHLEGLRQPAAMAAE